jgi:hypothetical protein
MVRLTGRNSCPILNNDRNNYYGAAEIGAGENTAPINGEKLPIGLMLWS